MQIRIMEFFLLFLAAPVLLATALPADLMFPSLFAVTAFGVVMLHITPGFHWHDLTRNLSALRSPAVFWTALSTALTGATVMLTLHPGEIFRLPLERPGLTLMIVLLYPVLSALPQELVFRPLFFRRYGGFLPAGWPGIVINAAVFSLAHLMYWSWIVAAMTFSGGLIFAWAYERRQSFPLAVALHSLCGIIVFLLGLGIYFYSGNVERPF